MGSSPESGRFCGERNGNPLRYYCLANPMDRGAWLATVHGVARVGHNLATKAPPPFICLYFLAMPRSMQDLIAPVGIEPMTLAVEVGSFIHWTTKEVPWLVFRLYKIYSWKSRFKYWSCPNYIRLISSSGRVWYVMIISQWQSMSLILLLYSILF